MLSKTQEKLIRSLQRGKARQETGLCLVEGTKCIEAAGSAVELTFSRSDTPNFDRLVSTESPQDLAATARIPRWSPDSLAETDTMVVLDGVQDPGNVGTILRLCLGFRASLLLIESADPTAPKTVRSSTGAMFTVPWLKMGPKEATKWLNESDRPVFRLEKRNDCLPPEELKPPEKIILIAGSEGSGIRLNVDGQSVAVPHDERLESLNVAHALAIALYCRRQD